MATTPVTLTNATDTYVGQAFPSKNHQSLTRLGVRAGTGVNAYAFVYFSRPFPLGSTIVSATLKVYNTDAWTGSNTLTLRTLTSAFQVSTTTYNKQPTVSSTDTKALTKTAPAAKTEWAFDVKTHMQAVADGTKWYGWRIETNSTTHRWLNSAQAPGFKPVLEVVYSEAPSPPTGLKPSGGQVVGVTRPTLTFGFNDKAGNTSPAGYRVQMNTTDVWTAPSYDTRAVASTAMQHDLTASISRTASVAKTSGSTAMTSTDAAFTQADVGSTITGTGIPAGATIASVQSATAATLSAAATTTSTVTATITESFAGLAAGAVMYWRVQVQDGSGLWSDWSDSTSFTYQPKGVLTITNPSGTTISDTTPPIFWTFTGQTQAGWRVRIDDASGKQIYSNPERVMDGQTSFTIPPGYIKKDNTTYTITVRVFDNLNRVTTPNDTTFVEASKTVTYTYSASTAPVTTLAATNPAGTPRVVLTWNRSTAPDAFTVRRNSAGTAGTGEVIADSIDSADLFVSGTQYTYTDYSAVPNKVNKYTVDAVTNNLASTSSPSISITPAPVGIWLADPDRAISVQLMGTDEGSWDMGEVSGVYSPIGASKSIVVTQALRGYEGELSGQLLNTGGATVAAQEADMWLLKGSQSTQTYVLTLADIAIPVVIYNVSIAPSPLKEIVKNVSFSFVQVGNLPFEGIT